MEVGFVIPHIGRDVSVSVIDTTCAVAEELGADALWFGDHIVFPYDYQSAYPYGTRTGFTPSDPEPFWEAFTVMAYVAARTERVKLCTGVAILPYRHPLLTAKIVATIDRLSGGRVMFGAGVGWLEEEFEALGLDTFGRRGSVSDEQLEVILKAWSEERPTFEGSYYQFPSVSLTPKPVQRPHPPILIGGNSPAAFRRVIRFGDYWHAAMLFPGELVEGRATLAAMAHQSGRRHGSGYVLTHFHISDQGRWPTGRRCLRPNVGRPSPGRRTRSSPSSRPIGRPGWTCCKRRSRAMERLAEERTSSATFSKACGRRYRRARGAT